MTELFAFICSVLAEPAEICAIGFHVTPAAQRAETGSPLSRGPTPYRRVQAPQTAESFPNSPHTGMPKSMPTQRAEGLPTIATPTK